MPNTDLISRVRLLVRPAILLEPFTPRPGQTLAITQSKFGGTPYAERGDAWPICGGCGKGLAFIMQAHLDECEKAAATEGDEPKPDDDRRSGLVVFFYCQQCSSWGDIPADLKDAWVVRRYDTPSESKAVELADLSPADLRTKPCAVMISPAVSLPDWESLDTVDPELSNLSASLDHDEPWEPYSSACTEVLGEEPSCRTQIGGYPSFIQGANFPDCSECGQAMRLLMQIDSEDDAGLMWGDAGSVYLFECPKHPKNVQMRLQCY
jgi:uncharacterized protein YwqG